MTSLRKLVRVFVDWGVLVLLSAGVAGAVLLEGVEVADGEPPLAPPPVVVERGLCSSPGAGNTFINFDEAAQPCMFAETTALRDEYLGFGVAFSHKIDRDGGTVLDECSKFGVSGHSSPNFFAVDCASTYPDGGRAQGPAIMTFTSAVGAVSVLVGSQAGQGIELTMEAYNLDSQLLDTAGLVLAPEMQVLSVAAQGIRKVVVGVHRPCAWVLDDLCFDTVASPVEPSTWGAVKAVFK